MLFLLFTKCCSGDQENATDIGGACDEYEEEAKSTVYRQSRYFTPLNSITRSCDSLSNHYRHTNSNHLADLRDK
jgi:hypothetical protein